MFDFIPNKDNAGYKIKVWYTRRDFASGNIEYSFTVTFTEMISETRRRFFGLFERTYVVDCDRVYKKIYRESVVPKKLLACYEIDSENIHVMPKGTPAKEAYAKFKQVYSLLEFDESINHCKYE